MEKKYAIIIGAGPAGLTAAMELLSHGDTIPIVLEETGDIGGISKTVNYKGNRIDIGGHRFFSKSDWVMNWWQDIFPVMGAPARDDLRLGRKVSLSAREGAPDPEKADNVLLVRSRLSRIFFLRKFFDYPITLSVATLSNLGARRMARIMASYLRVRLFPVKDERSLEDFFVNRFGRELYATFFRDYTEKVWGVPCRQIKPEWGAQRIKGLSILKALQHAIKRLLRSDWQGDIRQKGMETSLIEQFLYPKFGPGQLWESVARQIEEGGGEIRLHSRVTAVHCQGNRVNGVTVADQRSGTSERIDGNVVFSSMPVRDLVASFDPAAPVDVQKVAEGLVYRDFITVGLLLRGLKIDKGEELSLRDNWIYIQENDVCVGRIQIFNNWSPYMVSDPDNVWLGMEFFCNMGDDLWSLSNDQMSGLAADELRKLGFIEKGAVIDSVVIRVPKAYPAYFGSYDEFDQIRDFTDKFENLFLIGRNGMHRYNNMDHSMLTAKEAVGQLIKGSTDKKVIWSVNTEKEYHEEK